MGPKMLVGVNIDIPGFEYVEYTSDRSLRDFDIAIISPKLPHLDRVYFDGGGSCMAIESTEVLSRAIRHWRSEILSALSHGKTIFFVADEPETDQAAIGSEMKTARQRIYKTTHIQNYSVLPISLDHKAAKGKKIECKGSLLRGISAVLDDHIEYRALFSTKFPDDKMLCARGGEAVGGVLRLRDRSGALVILPYFDFPHDDFTELNDEGEHVWTKKALKTGAAIQGQLSVIDKELRAGTEKAPPPDWVSGEAIPADVTQLEEQIEASVLAIREAEAELSAKRQAREDLLSIQALLYDNGKSLEVAVEKALSLMGYSVSAYRQDDLEIDHVILSPEGDRYIGETEGKDKSAIDIKKFRQLESNINEDFERDDVDSPARGILFGNGYRLIAPDMREEQFTRKSLTNAHRLGVILVRTSDLYPLAVYLTDHPDDEEFAENCRAALSKSIGQIVEFPPIP